MEEESGNTSSKLRLVRCPKCENLLPELQNVPVYQCGGCGAVLQAKKQLVVSNGISSNGSSEKSVEVAGFRVGTEKLDEKKGDFDLSTKDNSDLDSTSNGGVVESKLNVLPEKQDMENVVVSRNVSGESSNNVVVDAHVGHNRDEQIRVNILESRERDRSTAYRRTSRFVVQDVSFSLSNEEEVGGFKPSDGVANGYGRAEHVNGYKDSERDDATYRRAPRVVNDVNVNFSGCSYPSEGPSNYQPGSSYGNGENHLDGMQDRVEFLEQDRAELLRKLDELKEQLTKSCEVSEKTKQRVSPPPPYAGQNNRLPNNGARSQQVFSQPFSADEHIRKPPYVSHVHEHVPMMHGHEMDMQNFYSAHVNVVNDRRGHGDLFGPNMLGRAPNRQRREYPQQPSNGYYSGQVIDSEPELISPYPHNNTFFHQPECPCSHCYNKSWLPPKQGLPMSFPNRKFADGPGNSAFYHLDEPRAYDPWGYNHRSTNLPLYSHNPHIQMRRKNDHDTATGGFGRDCVKRVPPAKRNGRHHLPIAGGAPFITCSNCFQLLPLPKKLLLMEKNRQQLRCGSCSSVMSISFEDKKLVITVPTQIIEVPLETNDSSDQALDGGYQGQVNYYPDDYDTAGCNFVHMDELLNSSESEKMQGNLTSSSGTFEDEGSPESMIAQQEASSSTELPKKAILSPTLTGSPIHENYDHPTDQLVSKFGKGNMSKRTDQEKIVVARAASRQNSFKDGMLATEMEISFNDYTNNGVCHNSKEANKEEDRPRNGKSGNSLLAGLIKKSFKSNNSRENDGVFVNGKLISDRLVKKAEKQAGPIRPGSYWYDSRAGFWGVMGQHCLGIIPPFIEEFSCQIPINCSSGDTGVLVNGRELHQKDLDLLASRGLPTESDKSYIVEISGRILDEDSGEELDSLGKLAPTVERLKRGFGMRVPPTVSA